MNYIQQTRQITLNICKAISFLLLVCLFHTNNPWNISFIGNVVNNQIFPQLKLIKQNLNETVNGNLTTSMNYLILKSF